MVSRRAKISSVVAATCILLIGGAWWWQKNKTPAPNAQGPFVMVEEDHDLIYDVPLTNEVAKNEYVKRLNELESRQAQLTSEEDRINFFNDRALYYSYLGDYQKSLELYEESLRIDQNYRRTWLAVGGLMEKMQAWRNAEIAYQRAIELFGYDYIGYDKLAGLYRKAYPQDQTKIQQAYEQGLAAIENNVTYEPVLAENYVIWLIEKRRFDEAIGQLEKMKLKLPDRSAALEQQITELKQQR